MNVLQIPIIDEYWVPPKDPAASARSRDFAISLGFGESRVEANRAMCARADCIPRPWLCRQRTRSQCVVKLNAQSESASISRLFRTSISYQSSSTIEEVQFS